MKDFAGFDDFIPIFQGGKQIDSQGIEHDGNELIDQAVASFSPEHHEPPVVVGHPKDNSPAFGWVEGLKKIAQTLKDGTKINVLMAKFKDVVPEFASAVQQGLYKKRSASFYPDGRLRHVGFLGGMPPAVKGLADLKFSSNDGSIEFEESIDFMAGWWGMERTAGLFRRLREFFIEKFDLETADRVLASVDIDSIKDSADQLSRIEIPQTAATPLFSEKEANMPKTFTEEEMQAQLTAEREKITAEKNAEFAETKKRADEAVVAATKAEEKGRQDLETVKAAIRLELETKFAERERLIKATSHKKEIAEFVSSGIQTGKVLPAWQKMGLAQFMEGLGAEQVINFGEATGEKTPYEFFKSFLAELPKTVDFGEFAIRTKNVGGMGSAGQQLTDLISKKMKGDPKLDYMIAFTEAQVENPDLAKEYEREIHRSAN